MPTSIRIDPTIVAEPLAVEVSVTDDDLVVTLQDGRVISTPLVWYPRLLVATPSQRAKWELIADGHGVSWPQLNEDLSVEGMLAGRPACDNHSKRLRAELEAKSGA